MEDKSTFRKNFLSISHLPSIILLIGYISYWVELYFIKRGNGLTSPFAYILFISFSIFVLFAKRKEIFQFLLWLTKEYKKLDKFTRYFLTLSFGIIFLIGIVVFFALLQPPHLSQEFDALNYHLTLPRQHLILNSFKHIEWSSADLFLLPIQFALAPYWLIREIPSKFIQIFFIFGLIAIPINLVRRFSRNNFLSLYIVILAILGSHGLGVQMGTVMLDLVICYLFLAVLDSFLNGAIFLGLAEFTFFIWAKSFMPLQILLITVVIFILFMVLRKMGFKNIRWGFVGATDMSLLKKYRRLIKKILLVFILLSFVIAGPFLAKTVYCAGTPLFPFVPGIIKINNNIDYQSKAWKSILSSSQYHMATKDAYGHNRSLINFFKHFWLIAVPEKGVNNKFDYPLGLPYLLFLGPFLYFTIRVLRDKIFLILPLFALIYWFTWWFGSQQARFLYIPLVLMFIVVSSVVKKPSRIFISALIVALLFNFISIFRAHYKDFGLPAKKILRERDKQLLEMNKKYFEDNNKRIVVLNYFDAAYAQFPVEIKPGEKKGLLPWVLRQ